MVLSFHDPTIPSEQGKADIHAIYGSPSVLDLEPYKVDILIHAREESRHYYRTREPVRNYSFFP